MGCQMAGAEYLLDNQYQSLQQRMSKGHLSGQIPINPTNIVTNEDGFSPKTRQTPFVKLLLAPLQVHSSSASIFFTTSL